MLKVKSPTQASLSHGEKAPDDAVVSDASRSALVEQLLRLGCSAEGLLAG
jgi:hypothetical protein